MAQNICSWPLTLCAGVIFQAAAESDHAQIFDSWLKGVDTFGVGPVRTGFNEIET